MSSLLEQYREWADIIYQPLISAFLRDNRSEKISREETAIANFMLIGILLSLKENGNEEHIHELNRIKNILYDR